MVGAAARLRACAASRRPRAVPMYSTWYNYHQNVDAAVLLKEVAVAKKMGFDSIIVDDGWQTLDTRAATPTRATGSPSACPT